MRSRGLCPLLLLAVLTPSLLCRPAAAAEGSSSDRRLTVAIEPFADHAADPRFAPLLAGLPELLAFALTDEERVVAIARRDRFSVTAEEEAAPSFKAFGSLEDRESADLILKGQIFTYRGRVRLRGQLVPPAGGSVREVSSEMVEVERIFAGIDRFVEALRAEIADIRRGSLPNLVVLPCFAEAGEPPTGDLSWLASELPSSVLSHLDLESVDLELGSGVEEGCREPGESLGEIFERLEPAGLVLGTYALGEPMTVTASLLTGEERPPIQIAWLQRSFSSLLELERNLAADIGAALGAVARGGGKWQPEPLLDLPADVEGLLQAAEASLGKEETLFRAVLLFSRAVQADPDRAAGHLGLGLARSQQGRHREATGHLRRAIELDGASARAHRELGRSLFELGREEEALEILGTALDLDPESVETWRLLAEINGLIGDAQEAIAQYREVLERDPGDTEACRRLAESLQLEGREGEAEEVLKSGLENNPGDPLLLSTLAEIYSARGRRLAMDGDYRAALVELRR
ncbi:MAG: tetratricopeptide repeat protein, partial [Thermoanaerobaculia bacterium]|nr:tetratricopeptide repeat protein [Thermoanaerobaculia bacterium]